ncbi:hypothetical protein M378DRAFT_158332 [Amanita muscaria Koide BX008]|uniref:Uncharacterized protein n=1 Tax=Amanita muscaria (strain Koide BX008) TaxID=946122 RepID=A0A0C2XGI9_AMAMK|nr:hypothetical protein M378DRAFT_158332 [Amanita muscaria Koide BX008]
MPKRKADDDDDERSHTTSQPITSSVQPPPPNPQANRPTKTPNDSAETDKGPKRRLRKLVPPRPWAVNPSNTTGPRSARQCKNYISLTRKTALGAYLRRCKSLILDDGCVTKAFIDINPTCNPVTR